MKRSMIFGLCINTLLLAVLCYLVLFSSPYKTGVKIFQQNPQIQRKTTREFEDIPHSANPVGNSFSSQQAIQQSLGNSNLSQVRPFGNGVYYFPFVEDEFRYTISAFLSVHTNLEVLAVSEDVVRQSVRQSPGDDYRGNYGPYGVTVGHTIFFREKH